MFNLDQAIAEWRRQMAVGGVRTGTVLDELESHLREDVESMMREGLHAEKALAAAIERIGPAGPLGLEFGKVRLERPARSWKTFRISCLLTALFITLIGAWSLLVFEQNAANRALGLLLVCFTGIYIASLPHWYGPLPLARKAALRKALFVASLIVAAWTFVCLFGALGWINWRLGESLILGAIFWPLCAACGLTSLADMYFLGTDAIGSALICSPSLNQFTPVARSSLEIARREAAVFHHDYIGTEHLLLALLQLAKEDGDHPVTTLGLDFERVRAEVKKLVVEGAVHSLAPVLPYTPRLGRALNLAAKEALRMNRSVIGDGELLLGLLVEGEGVAAIALRNLGVDIKTARAKLALRT